MPEWHASFFIARLHSLVPTLLTLVVKHADIKTKNVENRRNRFYITAIAYLPKSHISPDRPASRPISA